MKDYFNLDLNDLKEILEKERYEKNGYIYEYVFHVNVWLIVNIYKDGKLIAERETFNLNESPIETKKKEEKLKIQQAEKEEKKRLKEKNKKVCDVKVRLSEEMYEKLKKNVQEQNTTVSEYIRKLIQEKMGE